MSKRHEHFSWTHYSQPLCRALAWRSRHSSYKCIPNNTFFSFVTRLRVTQVLNAVTRGAGGRREREEAARWSYGMRVITPSPGSARGMKGNEQFNESRHRETREVHILPLPKTKINHKFKSNRLGKGHVAMGSVTEVVHVFDASRHLKNGRYIIFLWQKIATTTIRKQQPREPVRGNENLSNLIQFSSSQGTERNVRYKFFLFPKKAKVNNHRYKNYTTGKWCVATGVLAKIHQTKGTYIFSRIYSYLSPPLHRCLQIYLHPRSSLSSLPHNFLFTLFHLLCFIVGD